eukprot:8383201-Ditylum_brightwellii.AAC.1
MGTNNVQRQVRRNICTHECPKEITKYQNNVDAVDRGDQACLKGCGFCSKIHHKKWYKKCQFGVFTAIASEELIATDTDEDDKTLTNNMSVSLLIARRHEGHVPTMDLGQTYREYFTDTRHACLSCDVCAVEETTCMHILVMKLKRVFSQGMRG